MKTKTKHIIIALAFASFLALSFIFDSNIITAVQNARGPFLDSFFSFFLFIENGFIFYPLVVIATLAIFLVAKRKEKTFKYIASAAAVAAITLVLKWIVARQRPDMTSDSSFPSGHTSFIFTSLFFFDKKAVKIIWLILSCMFAFTRIWFNLHYPSDIVFGAILGFYIPFLVNFFFRKFRK